MFKAKYMLVGSRITNQIKNVFKNTIKIKFKNTRKKKRTRGIKIRAVNYGFT